MTKNNEAGWNFDNSYAKLPNVFFSHLNPTPVRDPGLVILNEKLAKTLGLNLAELKSENGLAVFAGNDIPDTATPIAQAYAGHQFGHFNMLGDGRAILLGEHLTPNGDRVDIQLKGPGRTPYSRGGDGRAALGPMLREYIISEAMYALGIPTTRSLAVVTTGESIFRDRILPGAILTRVAASHIRVGTFEFAAKWTSKEDLQSLADYTMKRHFPEVRVKDYLGFLQAVVKRQADLIAKWQLVGFIHGVMNTDNMVISGETIDYGPCAFMDTYDPGTVFSSIDRQGRYAYINQPYKARWNLTRFAEALMPLLHEKMEEAMELVKEVLSTFNVLYEENWLTGMRAKLGLFGKEEEDRALIDDLLLLMENYQADYTNTFCAFTLDKLTNSPLFEAQDFIEWYARWQSRLQKQHQTKEESQQLMRKVNPAVIPRNHLVEEALEAAEARNDDRVLHKLLEILANPYAYSKEQEEYSKVPVSSTPYQTFCGT